MMLIYCTIRISLMGSLVNLKYSQMPFINYRNLLVCIRAYTKCCFILVICYIVLYYKMPTKTCEKLAFLKRKIRLRNYSKTNLLLGAPHSHLHTIPQRRIVAIWMIFCFKILFPWAAWYTMLLVNQYAPFLFQNTDTLTICHVLIFAGGWVF